MKSHGIVLLAMLALVQTSVRPALADHRKDETVRDYVYSLQGLSDEELQRESVRLSHEINVSPSCAEMDKFKSLKVASGSTAAASIALVAASIYFAPAVGVVTVAGFVFGGMNVAIHGLNYINESDHHDNAAQVCGPILLRQELALQAIARRNAEMGKKGIDTRRLSYKQVENGSGKSQWQMPEHAAGKAK